MTPAIAPERCSISDMGGFMKASRHHHVRGRMKSVRSNGKSTKRDAILNATLEVVANKTQNPWQVLAMTGG
jgi:hypothetical protein